MTDINNLLLNLKILSHLGEFEKLKIDQKVNNNNSIDHVYTISTNNYFQCIQRWWHQQSREDTIKHLFNLIAEVKINTKSANNIKDDNFEQQKILYQLEKELSGSMNGLQSLKITYKDDKKMVAQLDLIIEEFELQLIILQNYKNKYKKIKDTSGKNKTKDREKSKRRSTSDSE